MEAFFSNVAAIYRKEIRPDAINPGAESVMRKDKSITR
jgi:hypothetical protein